MTDSIKFLQMWSDEYNANYLSSHIINNPDFAKWSACAKRSDGSINHHYGQGGLAQHTLEVFEIARASNIALKSPVNPKWLFLACLYHDVGKLHDYVHDKWYIEWSYSPHKKKIHHICRSALIWHGYNANITHPKEDENMVDEVLHAILAHHGQREWGSPVTPQTKLAWLLHLADMTSARLNYGTLS